MGTLSGIALGVTLATPITAFATNLINKASEKIVEYTPSVFEKAGELAPQILERMQ